MAVYGVVAHDLVYAVGFAEVESVGDAEFVRGAVGLVAGVLLYRDVGAFESHSRRNLREHGRLSDIDSTDAALVYGAVEFLTAVTHVHYAVTDSFFKVEAGFTVRTVFARLRFSVVDELLTYLCKR